MRILAFLSAFLLAGGAGVNHPGATGTSAINPGASSGSGAATRGPQTAVDEETSEGSAQGAGQDAEDRRRTEAGRVNVPGAAGTPESLPLPAPMPGVPGPAQGAPGEGPGETGPRDRTLRPGG